MLESCYPESELEAYGTALQLDITDWEKAPVVTLREASKSANPSNAYYGTTCHCKKGCGGMQCSCRKAGKPCSSRCHSGRPCKNCSGHAVQEHNSLKHSELCASLDQSSDFTSSPRSLSPAHSPVKHKAVSTITTCNCKSGCGGKRCSCRKTGKPCSSQCHSGRPCKNCSGHAVQEHNSLKHSELCASLDQSSDFTSSPRSLSPAHSPVKHKAVSTITTCNCKSGCGGKRCSCRKAGNPCSPWCHCHLGKPCQNSGYDSGQGDYKECNSPDQSSSFASLRSPLSPLSQSSAEKISVSSSSSPAALDWWVKDLLLTVEDKEILESGRWLNDKHISAAQQLLRKQYPFVSGLQNPILGSNLTFDVMETEGVQIINHRNHWTCLSTIGCQPSEVNVYDSLHARLSASAMKQTCSMLNTTEAKLTVRMRKVQIQSGGSDCGVFAIAFAVCLCEGKDPCSISWTQPLMRQHLVKCLSKQRMTPFPGKPHKECM